MLQIGKKPCCALAAATLLVAGTVSCRPEPAVKKVSPESVGFDPSARRDDVAPGARANSAKALQERLAQAARDDRWEEYWAAVVDACHQTPPPVSLRIAELMPLVNRYPDWSGSLEFGRIAIEHGALAVTLHALDRLAARAPADQACEAKYASAMLIAVIRGPDAASDRWRELAKAHPNHPAGQAAALEVWEYDHLRVGRKLPAAKWSDRSGKIIDLDALQQPAVIYFWSANCGPCKGTIEQIRLQSRRWGPAVEIIAVNCDEDRSEYDSALKALDPPGRSVFLADQPEYAQYKVAGYPLVLIADSDAKIVSRNCSPDEYGKFLNQARKGTNR